MSTRRGTLLWIDVPGLGSRVSAQPYAEGARMMRVFRGILLPPCDAFGGRLASAVGDSFQIVFRRPTDAVLAAAAVQDRAAQHARGSGERPDLRACVVSGEMRVDRNGVIGDLVDLAARVRGAAGRGDVVLSGDVFAAMDKSRLTAEELGDADGVPAEVRLYRLARARGSDLPFGGVGLARAGRLPGIGPDGLLQGGDSAAARAIAPVRAAVARAVAPARGALGDVAPRVLDLLGSGSAWAGRQYGRLPPGVRALPSAAAARIARIPRKAQVAIAGGLVVLLAAAVLLSTRRTDPIERALAQHDFRAARQELKQIKDGQERVFADARIQEARGSFGPAADGYAKAAKGGERRGLQQLVRMTESKSCDARASAARALGELGDERALPALRKLAQGKFADERRGPFRCSSKRAAREALEQLHTRTG
ncbi:MAG TPA: HEAT repeat domain-containing protein [Myxococcales bacterium]